MYYKNLIELKNQYHPECIFNTELFDLKISFNNDGELIGHFYCDEKYQGYSGRIHGGILSGIIDSAMTRCLFGHNIIAYTVRLNIKYSQPVEINKNAVIKVKIIEKYKNLYYVINACILQDNKKLVTADAKFWIDKDLTKD